MLVRGLQKPQRGTSKRGRQAIDITAALILWQQPEGKIATSANSRLCQLLLIASLPDSCLTATELPD